MGRPINKRYMKENSGSQIICHIKLMNEPVQIGIVEQFGTRKYKVNVNGILHECSLVQKNDNQLLDNEINIKIKYEGTFHHIIWIKGRTVKLTENKIVPWYIEDEKPLYTKGMACVETYGNSYSTEPVQHVMTNKEYFLHEMVREKSLDIHVSENDHIVICGYNPSSSTLLSDQLELVTICNNYDVSSFIAIYKPLVTGNITIDLTSDKYANYALFGPLYIRSEHIDIDEETISKSRGKGSVILRENKTLVMFENDVNTNTQNVFLTSGVQLTYIEKVTAETGWIFNNSYEHYRQSEDAITYDFTGPFPSPLGLRLNCVIDEGAYIIVQFRNSETKEYNTTKYDSPRISPLYFGMALDGEYDQIKITAFGRVSVYEAIPYYVARYLNYTEFTGICTTDNISGYVSITL